MTIAFKFWYILFANIIWAIHLAALELGLHVRRCLPFCSDETQFCVALDAAKKTFECFLYSGIMSFDQEKYILRSVIIVIFTICILKYQTNHGTIQTTIINIVCCTCYRLTVRTVICGYNLGKFKNQSGFLWDFKNKNMHGFL